MNIMIDWQQRFEEQLKWTKDFRNYLFSKIDLKNVRTVLDIGCGTGNLLIELGKKYNFELYGIDINENRLKIADKWLKRQKIRANLYHMDLLDNNLKSERFDLILTHLFFLWVKDHEKAFYEIHRLLKESGTLLILAEPDYGGLIEYPDTGLKKALINSLKKEGADPFIGRKLQCFFKSKFKIKEAFTLSIPWLSYNNREGLKKEIEFFEELLKDEPQFNLNELIKSINTENYFLFNPVFSYFLSKIK